MLKYTTMYVKILEALHEVELVLVEAFFKLMCSNFYEILHRCKMEPIIH